MMMSQRHLSELLEEDQEPFLLQNYIADRRTQIKRPSTKTHLQVKKRKPISETSSFTGNLCKNACFFSFQDSPDMKKSPLFEFPSPVAKSPCRSPNDIFLNIPARTAAVLLEAALRIQKQSSSSKTKTQNKSHGFGLFGSLLKRLTHKNRNRKREIGDDGVKVSLRDTLRWDSSVGHRKFSKGNKELQEKTLDLKEKSTCEISAFDQLGFSCSCNGSRPSSVVWSETNEDKSMDVETSSSSQSEDSGETDFVSKQRLNTTDCACCDNNGFCESPFRFELQMSPFPGCRTPDFMSPAASPSRRATEEKVNNGAKDLKKFLSDEEEEEDKEQCSPVSVLDPPFEEDDDGHENENESENDDEDDGFDLECSYAILQRAKQQLLHKLRRFEKLAELDPLELEKRILDHEEDDNGDIDDQEKEEDCEDYYMETSDKERNFKRLVAEALTSMSSFDNIQLIPEDLKRLVSDIILEEETELSSLDDREVVMKRVCKRLELWKEVESNTINMMVEQDFCREEEGWKRCQEQVREIVGDLELDILSFLVQELSEEHVC